MTMRPFIPRILSEEIRGLNKQIIEQREKEGDYFFPPHGGRPPLEKEIRKATKLYIKLEKQGKLKCRTCRTI